MRKDTQAETHSAKALRRLAASAAVLLAVCLVLMTPVSAVEPDTDWYDPSDSTKGIETNPYVITTAEQLFGLAQLVNGQAQQQQPEDFTGKYIKLEPANDADSIDLAELGLPTWTPIGVIDGYMFNGTFIGNGKTIKGLHVTYSPQSTPSPGNTPTIQPSVPNNAGLFGYIGPGGSVSGLTVEGSIVVDSDNQQIELYAGGIAGVNKGRISDSAFLGTVSAKNSNPPANAGGIAGKNEDGIIENCYTTGAVSAESSQAPARAGGIAGYNYADSGSASIQNCYATGAVSATRPSSQPGAPASAGGIAGYNYAGSGSASIMNCYALNEAVTATGFSTYAARVAGYSVDTNDYPLSPGTNYGWKHMTVNTVLVTGQDDLNATSICAVKILSPENTHWSSDIWNLDRANEDYKLPVLKNSNTNPSETPEHLLVEVTFNANGGTPTPTSQKVLDGALVMEPTGLVKTGYTLEGWYTEENFQNKWVFTAIVCPPDFPLYANWTLTSSQGGDEGTGGSGGDDTGGDNTGGDNTGTSGEPEAPANNNNGGGGGGSEGTYDTFPRNTDENGDADFGKSPVVIRIDLPEETDTAVTLITNPETPDTEDTDVYYEFELDIPDYPEETEGDVIWRIPKSLLNDEFGADDYGVYVYDEDEWKPLDSVWEEGDGNYLHYTTKITGDGNFIIVKEKGISKKAGDDTPVVTPGDEPQDTPGTVLPPSSGTETPDDETEIPILGIGIGLLILILVIAGIVFAVSRRK